MPCTLPHAFGFWRWFEQRFADLCIRHDAAYQMRTGKLRADWRLVSGIWSRGYRTLALASLLCVCTVGCWHYYRGAKHDA